jgi:hypothetical protein
LAGSTPCSGPRPSFLPIEHAIRGELTAYPPFFTALQAGQGGAMLREIAVNGVIMTVAVVVVWAMVVAIAGLRERAKSLAAIAAKPAE